MINLGTFQKDQKTGRIAGYFYGVNIAETKLVFEQASGEKGQKYYKVFAEAEHVTVEAGAAWPKVARTEGAKAYLDVKLNSPGLNQPIYAKLFQSDVVSNQYHLLWDAPKQSPSPSPERHSSQPLTF
jgi:uncharacterized protein (DUF736 family)